MDIGSPAEDLYETLCDVLSMSTSELNEKGLHGRQWMIDCFSWQQVATDIAGAYSWVLGDGSCPAFVLHTAGCDSPQPPALSITQEYRHHSE